MNSKLPGDLSHFGDRLEWAIARSEYATKSALARDLEIRPQQLSNWLARETPPARSSVRRLSELLPVPESWLAYGVDNGRAVVREPHEAYERPPIAQAPFGLPELEAWIRSEPSRARKREALLGWRRVVEAMRGVVPDRYYELMDEIENGEPPALP
jgi:transcriptional regulator with XRE-family HTH domain